MSRTIKFCGLCLVVILMAFALIFLDKGAKAMITDQFATFAESMPIIGGGSSTQEEESLNEFFQSPSKELNVPATNAFFQDVPSVTNANEKPAIDTFSKQMENEITKDSFNVKDFLPQEIREEWFQTDLTNAKGEVDQAALIDISKFCQGVDTVGQSLKNPSYDLRGNIPNPKIIVSPFLNSSYDPDTNIKSWN